MPRNYAATVGFAVALVVGSGLAAAETAPDEIVWGEYGDIPEPLTDQAGDPDAGRAIMSVGALGNCVACHTNSEMYDDVPFHGTIAPELEGAGDRWEEAQLRGIIVDAKRMFPDSFMPGFYKVGPFTRPGVAFSGEAPQQPSDMKPILTAQQVEDIVAYLMTLKYE
ncbi:MAG: sulfur oxidation c-type cytochrome SoxX [Paracoccus sp. (in: a-proteobacteria)]|nr:sulfur oxidation c-type cytochrome SoxX [Paracoccus sp. (in: a-proteobacteria)]